MMKTKWQAVLEVMADGRFARVGTCGHKHPSEKLAGQCAERWEQADERIRDEEGLGQSAKRYFPEAIGQSEEKQGCPICGEIHGPRGLVFDGKGVNGCDGFRSRLATFESKIPDPVVKKLGNLFAAAPELLEVCKAIAAESRAGLSWSANNIAALNAAIAKAERGDK